VTCAIRPWKPEDAPALAAALNNKRVQENLRDGIPYPYTESDALDYIGAMLRADPNTTFAFAITADGHVVGSIGVFRKDNIHFRTAELGYYVAEPFWGKGLGSAAVGQVCRYIFENTDILRIFAEPFARNAASCRILEKNDFAYEGTLRSNAVKDGAVLDMKLYARIRP
jgi:RimJ/RimL family protein N-acetyltransferase